MTVPTDAADPDLTEADDDVGSLVEGRLVPLAYAVLATLALMFLTGAAVYAWQQWAHEPRPNDVDVGFADDMTTHHLQGVEMSLRYLEDGTDPVLRQIANEIVLVQAGEARLLGQAMEDWGRPDVDLDTAMAWMGMAPVPQDQQPGMATEAQMAELEAAEGEELDDLFSRLMIDHHRGGVHMAAYAVEHGNVDDITRLAEAMVTTQRSEIAELNLRREALGLEPV